MADRILSVENLTAGYGKRPVVEGASFEINAGEIITLIGSNGCGKSTLLKTISGLLSPIEGKIFYKDKDIALLKDSERAKKMAFLFTDFAVREAISCFEVVSLGRYPYTGLLGLNSKEDIKIIEEAMKETDTLDLKNLNFLKLSDGQRQRVLLAKAIAQKPEIMLLDEPTTFLDVRYKLEFLSLLKRLSGTEGFSVIMSLHELDLARQISDEIICIKNGKIDLQGKPEEIFKEGYINKLFDIKQGSFDEKTSRALI